MLLRAGRSRENLLYILMLQLLCRTTVERDCPIILVHLLVLYALSFSIIIAHERLSQGKRIGTCLTGELEEKLNISHGFEPHRVDDEFQFQQIYTVQLP